MIVYRILVETMELVLTCSTTTNVIVSLDLMEKIVITVSSINAFNLSCFLQKKQWKCSLQMFILMIEFYVTCGENTENRGNKTFFHHHVRLVIRFVQKLFALVNSILVSSILEKEFGVDILILCFERSLCYLV